MEVITRWDGEGNPVFEVQSRCITFDSVALRKFAGRIISIANLDNRRLLGLARKDDGRVELNFIEIISHKKDNARIKREIVETLAHEVRHILQPKARMIDKLALFLLLPSSTLLLMALFLLVFSWVTAGGRYDWIPRLYFFSASAALVLFFGINLLYYFCPIERDARAFAKESLKDEEWLKVVKVEDKDTP